MAQIVGPCLADPPKPNGADKYGAWFDAQAADNAVLFIETYIKHTKGEWAGRPFKLQPWQRDRVIRPFFGWKRADGTRLYRTLWLEIPRKNGKTELAAAIALLLLLGDAEAGAEGYSLALDEAQAKIVFKVATTMIQYSRELQQLVECFKTGLFVPRTNGSFKPLSRSPDGKHGQNPSFFIGDEPHVWPDGELVQVVKDGMAARAQPAEIYTTTAGTNQSYFALDLHEYAEAVEAGKVVDPTFLAVIYAADPEGDWRDPAQWARANPNLGVSVKLEFLQKQCADAQRSPRLENNFKRFHLNLWTEQAVRWLPMHDWDLCSSFAKSDPGWEQLWPQLKGRQCFGGLDLAATRDVTALAWAFPPVDADDFWRFVWRMWLPGDEIEERSKHDKTPWDIWMREGVLSVTDGNVTDYDAIEAAIIKDCDSFDVQGIAYDRWNAQQIVNNLVDQGVPMIQFGQGYASMSAPTKEFERLVSAHKIEHGRNPIARHMAANVVTRADPAGNIKPDKEKARMKIDGIVAAIMAVGAATRGEKKETPPRSMYEDGSQW